MRRSLKIVSLAIGLTAFGMLAILGFAIWVFIPLLPAGLIFLVALIGIKRRSKSTELESALDVDPRKAA